MTREKLKDWLELIGIIAIVASLVFVGLELRQSRQIAIADIYQQRAALVIEVQNTSLVADRWGDAFSKMAANESLTADEEGILKFGNNPWFSYWENNHFQYEIGLLTEEQWLASYNSMRSRIRRPLYQEWWRENRDQWRESFAVEVDRAILEANQIYGQ
jgi:hypothetical protein